MRSTAKDSFVTIRGLLEATTKRFADSTAFKTAGRDITYGRFMLEIQVLGTYLLEKGLTSLAIIGKNSYDWILAYYAAVCSGITVIPLDKALPPDEILSCLERSHADALFCDEEFIPSIETALALYSQPQPKLISSAEMPKMLEHGKRYRLNGSTLYRDVSVSPNEGKILLFTSGTTSKSKAVLLSNLNITSNVYALNRYIGFSPKDVNMIFLPLHHTFGSTGLLMMLSNGVTNVFCRGLRYVQKDIVENRVTVFVGVPLLIENIYHKIMKEAAKQGKADKLQRAMNINLKLRGNYINLGKVFFRDIHKSLGGGLRCIVSGAAALDPEVSRGFDALGIDVVQGYGLTETSPVIASEPPNSRRYGSVGLPMCNVRVKIDNPDENGVGELLVCGPNVMKGYYNDSEETARVFRDGWFRTGDLAFIDNDGFIYIKGRKKNVIVLKNGKNVFPEELEEKINRLPFVKESLVYGEAKDSADNLIVCARIVYDPSLVNSEAEIQAEIDKLNETLPSFKRIKRISTTLEVMEKTTTMKIKRYAAIR